MPCPTLTQARALYPHRYTMEHVPQWARNPCGGKFYAPHFRTDAEWYAATAFPGEPACIGDDGKHCLTTGQTWPLGQWLDKPFRAP